MIEILNKKIFNNRNFANICPNNSKQLNTIDEWNYMWEQINKIFGDFVCLSESGETWQYMGTALYDEIWTHEFRHRDLNGERTYYTVIASNKGSALAWYKSLLRAP